VSAKPAAGRVVLARMNHETNMFSPVATPLASFGPDGPTFGPAALAEARGTRTGLGAFIDACIERGSDMRVAANASANPSGPVDDGAYERIAGAIVDEVARAQDEGGCEAVLLDLHGAMVTRSLEDGEGELLHRVRAIAPRVPIAMALDLHGNVSQAMVDHADVIVGFKTYPHIDMYETGAHAARVIFDRIDGRAHPVTAWAQLPLLSHTLKSGTATPGAMQRAVDRARAMESEGMLAVTVFAGFSLADIRDAGMSVVVVAESNRKTAQRAADALAAQMLAEREGFVYESAPLADSVAGARAAGARAAAGAGPVLLLDHGDNVMSGGTCDTLAVFEECRRQGLGGILMGPVCDSAAVAAAVSAKVGGTARLRIGNKVPLGLGADASPVSVTGTVRAITDGRFRITGPIYRGQLAAMGRTAVVDCEGATFVLTERPMEPLDIGVFTSAGVDPLAYRFVILKSRMYCRPVFTPMASAVIECDSRGVTSSDYSLFRFSRVRRPIYPLDA
jgi:microcystin degradation protein MlrC